MPVRTVLFDLYTYRVVRPDRPDPHTVTVYRGDTVTVTDEEAARGERLGGLGSAADLAMADAEAASDAGGLADDAELAGMTLDQVVAYLGQHPGEADRVADLEATRPKPRKTVATAVAATRELLAAEIAAREEAALAEAAAAADAQHDRDPDLESGNL